MSHIAGDARNQPKEREAITSNYASSGFFSKIPSTSGKKTKVSKTRTFLGCITCRNRKVKCDGKKPACERCQKANRHCEGYGFKLRFNELLVVDKNGDMIPMKVAINEEEKVTKRQQLPLMKMPEDCQYIDFQEIDQKLEQLDSLSEQNVNTYSCVGPFSIFPIRENYLQNKSGALDSRTEILSSRSVSIAMSGTDNTSENLGSKTDNSLPPISSLLKLSNLATNDSSFSSKPRPNRNILPLAPALEISHQTKLYHDERDQLVNSIHQISNSKQNIQLDDDSYRQSPTTLDDPIWVHPRLEIDAVLQYQTLIGSADVVTQSWDAIKKVIFAEKYGFIDQLKNKIIDKINLSSSDIEVFMKKHTSDVFRSLNDYEPATLPVTSFTSLLRSQRVQGLVRLFVKSHPAIMNLNFSGCIFDTIVIPTFYRVVGELMVFDSSMGLPGDWAGKVSQNGIDFRDYCDSLKRTFCMVALALTAFSQYKVLFDEHGIYDGSLKLFKCYICLREMSLINLAVIVKPFLCEKGFKEKDDEKDIKVALISRLLKANLLKELILTLLLAVYQDSSLDIINNYELLYGTLDYIMQLYSELEVENKEIDELWLWLRYSQFFYKSCSKIDIDNYCIDEEGLEDVKDDYNLIQNFEFNDHLKKDELHNIKIEPSKDAETSSYSGTTDIETSSSDEEDEIKVELPARLSKRPEIQDKPPKSFTVRFRFADTDTEDMNARKERESLNIDSSEKMEYKNNTLKPPRSDKVDALTGLDQENIDMSLLKREQLVEKGRVKISNSFNSYSDSSSLSPSFVELSFGIPLVLLELMERTVKLADHKNWCLRKKVFPRNFPKMCCDLEDRLMNWRLEWDLYSASGTGEDLQFHSLFHKAIYHLTVGFYNTILIYFFRLIKDIDPHLLQEHVNSVYNHLQQLKMLSLRSDFAKDMRVSPPFWCFMVAGSDAISKNLQYKFDELARKWFVAGNKWVGKQIMMEVWRIRNESVAENCGSISWLDILKDWEISGYQ